MNKADAKRVDRLIDDLFWLVTQSAIDFDLDGDDRDAVGLLRTKLEDALEGSESGRQS